VGEFFDHASTLARSPSSLRRVSPLSLLCSAPADPARERDAPETMRIWDFTC